MQCELALLGNDAVWSSVQLYPIQYTSNDVEPNNSFGCCDGSTTLALTSKLAELTLVFIHILKSTDR